MKWLALAVIGASLMVYGQEAKPHPDTHKGNPATASKDATKTTGQTVVVVNQQTPQGQEHSHTAQPPSYFRELFLPQNVPNIALVLVGIVGIFVALRTLQNIAKQTKLLLVYTAATRRGVLATRKSAEAAKVSAEAAKNSVEVFISKERARLRIETDKLKLEAPGEFSTHEVWHRITNHGSTPAFIVNSGAWAYISDSKEPSKNNVVMPPLLGYDSVLLPDAKPIKASTFFYGNDITNADIVAIMESRMFAHVYGFIKYRDAFDRERETRFRYVWHIIIRFEDGSHLGIWQQCGGLSDNCET